MCETVLKVHRIRFYSAQINSINCMAYNEHINKLALIRRRVYKKNAVQSDSLSTIEIWNFAHKSPFIEQTIYDDDNSPALLESILWTNSGRLFSCGLNSYLNEYDLNNSRIKRSYSVISGPVWCSAIDSSDSLIAVGTENGYLSVYVVRDENLEFDKVMDRNDRRILCLTWHRTKDNTPPLLISGSVEYIKIWNYQTGRCIDYIKLGEGVIVWCLAALDDFTLVSGDSSGSTSFWNGNTATLITSYQTHKADVLSIAVNGQQTTVYSAGVDPVIVQFNRMFKKYNSWVNTNSLNVHTHDVRALTCVKPNWIFSGGIDSYLMRCCYPPNLQLRYINDFAANIKIIKNYVLFQFETRIQIWKLGTAEEDVIPTVNYKILRIDENAVKLLEINSKRLVLTSTFNSNWISYSNRNNIKILFWNENELMKVPLLYEPIVNSNQMIICQEFLIVNCGTIIYILKLDKLGVIIDRRIDVQHRIYSMNSSNNLIAICLLDPKVTITVYDINNWTEITSFVNNLLPTVFEINPFNTNGEIWIAYANSKLIQFDVNESKIIRSLYKFDCFKPEDHNQMDDYWSIKQIIFADNCVIFSDDNLMYKLDVTTNKMTKCDKYQHIIKLGNQDKNEIAIVELTPDMLFSYLPKALDKKKFAT